MDDLMSVVHRSFFDRMHVVFRHRRHRDRQRLLRADTTVETQMIGLDALVPFIRLQVEAECLPSTGQRPFIMPAVERRLIDVKARTRIGVDAEPFTEGMANLSLISVDR